MSRISENTQAGSGHGSADDDLRTAIRVDAAAIARWLEERLASLLDIDRLSVDRRERFSRYGLDSVRALQLVTELGSWLDRQLPATLLWDQPSIDRVATYLADGDSEKRSEDIRAPGMAVDEPIAIVGMGCRFPGGADPDAFWRLLRDGVDAITEVPADRWDVDAHFDADLNVPGKMTTRWGGFLEHIDGFDAAFFGISPREALEMDPQQRLMLQVAWEALEDAGQPPGDLQESRTGVFFGVLWNDYAVLRQSAGADNITAHTATGAHYSIVANRLSYVLGLQGPSMAVDTACSSSLVAVHLACQSLRSGESTMALAGGVTLIAEPTSTVAMSKLGAMSPDGRSKAFDAAANGYVRGEGAGVIVLKRLSQAIASGDRIYAVIRGSAVNNDGFSNGLTAPNPRAQERLLRDAYQQAGIAPHQVQYVEAHGTGTPLGDPIEAKALGAILGANRAPGHACRVGSVKTNIGHTEAAAGIAGLIKVLLAMKYEELPPSLHFNRPNPQIPFEELGICIQAERSPWLAQGTPRVAGVSAFGFGGTNCHVVLEDMPQRTDHVLALGAGSAAELEALAREAKGILTATGGPLDIVARSAAAHASQGDHRLAVVASNVQQAEHALAQYLAGASKPAVIQGAGATAPRIVFVCSGHGSQWLGMGRETLQQEAAFRTKVEACDEAMRPLLGWSVLDELISAPSRLNEVNVVQPLLFVVQVAQAALWRSWGVEPSALVGHSIGEVSAAHIAGILDLEDAARVICSRSRLIREHASGHGQMAVVELPAHELRELTDRMGGRISIAAFNGPTTTVVAGEPTAVGELMTLLQRRGVFCRQIAMDYASHSPFVDAVREPLLAELTGIQGHRAEIPMMSTVTSSLLDGSCVDADYWASNEREPVQFWPAIAKLVRSGHDTFVELGGQATLSRQIEDALSHLRVQGQVIPSFRREEETRTLVEGIGKLHACGAPIRWSSVLPPAVTRQFTSDPAAAPPQPESQPMATHLFTLSARDAPALHTYAETGLAMLERSTDSVADLCYTSNVRRTHHDTRLAVPCQSVEDIRSGLSTFLQSREAMPHKAIPHQPKLAFVFPGQGGQWWGMGRELVYSEPVFRRAIDDCGRAMLRWVNWSLREELERAEVVSRVDEVDITQPATFAIQVALAALWRSWGITPDGVVGHSMGEVAAAHVAGALSLDDATRVICHRSRLLKRVSGTGAMAVVELSRNDAERAIADDSRHVSLAGSNSPQSTVLTGDPVALHRLLARLDNEGIFHRLLRVDVASHSPQMDPLRSELVDLLEGLAPHPAPTAIYSSVTAQPCTGTTLDAAYWGRNLRDPFLFADTIARMAADGYTMFIELGPHPILSGAIGDVQDTVETELIALHSLKRYKPERDTMLTSLGILYEHAYSPTWHNLHPNGGRLASLPSYPWQEERFWPSPQPRQPASEDRDARPVAGANPSPPNKELTSTRVARETHRGISVQLASAHEEDRIRLLTEHLGVTVAGVLRYAVDRLEFHRPLNTLGLDSILAADLRARIQREMGVRVPMVTLLRATTVDLATWVSKAMDPATPDPTDTARTSPALAQYALPDSQLAS